jgi:putative redox protein
MEKHTVSTRWKGEMAFEGEVSDHKVVIDSTNDENGKYRGLRPKPLMLLALAGCTGTDIIIILKKMRVQIDDLNIIVEGELTEELPKYYHTMRIIYEFTGPDPDPEKLQKAIALSEEKYCGVWALYRKASVNIISELRINGMKY